MSRLLLNRLRLLRRPSLLSRLLLGTVLAAKIATLGQALVVLVYNYGAWSLFKEDRLLMGLHMCMMLSPNEFPPDERDFFMNIATYVVDPGDAAHPGWTTQETEPAEQAATGTTRRRRCPLPNAPLLPRAAPAPPRRPPSPSAAALPPAPAPSPPVGGPPGGPSPPSPRRTERQVRYPLG